MKETIQAKLDKKDIKELRERAKKQGHTLSSLIRHIIKLFLATIKSGD